MSGLTREWEEAVASLEGANERVRQAMRTFLRACTTPFFIDDVPEIARGIAAVLGETDG